MLYDSYDTLCHDILMSVGFIDSIASPDAYCGCKEYLDAELTLKEKAKEQIQDTDYMSALDVFLKRLLPSPRVTISRQDEVLDQTSAIIE